MLDRRSSHFALVLVLAGASFAVAEVGEAKVKGHHRRFDSAPVALTSPLSTAPLRAGETVLLAWEPLPEMARHQGFEEWEAFLSLDGGGRYPVRLTPHLDLERRSFAVTLPSFAAERARLLLRFGDEVEEFEYEVPGEFEILPARQLNPEPVALARGRGEPARRGDPRDPGVAIWVEGSRAGNTLRTVAAARDGTSIDAIETTGWLGFRAATSAPEPPQAAAARLSSHPFSGLFTPGTTSAPAPPRAAPIEPRRTTCRQNE